MVVDLQVCSLIFRLLNHKKDWTWFLQLGLPCAEKEHKRHVCNESDIV